MSKIMVLAETGFGKSLSLVGNPEVGILGLNPKTTYVISATSKPLPRRGSQILFPVTTLPELIAGTNRKARRIITNDAYDAAKALEFFATNKSPITDIALDDSNYFMQDYFMDKALQTGWDAPKKVGHFMAKLFTAMEKLDKMGINVWLFAHYETYSKNTGGDISFRMKTTGKSVQDYITPEGKMDVVLYGKDMFNPTTKVMERVYVTNKDGEFPAKSSPGMFSELYIPNDCAIIKKAVDEYYIKEKELEAEMMAEMGIVPTPEVVQQPVTEPAPQPEADTPPQFVAESNPPENQTTS